MHTMTSYVWIFAVVCIVLPTKVTAKADVDSLQDVMTTLARQTMMQQLQMEEAARGGGHSGVKQVRFRRDGNRAYYSSSHTGGSAGAIHDHSNHYKTVGIGEFQAVMNGVDFRTRHNDYMLYMPSRNSTSYKVMEEIPYPDVPPEVLRQKGIDNQIVEMREWFKAWVNQDKKKRDYRKYFKPLLCYMEGAWMETDFGVIEEPFPSDRHTISAKSWFDLQEKIRFTAYQGGKDRLENFAFLPTKIVDIDPKTKKPIYAQWNYRILCHPIKQDLPLSYLQQVDDLHVRMADKKTQAEFLKTRRARFTFNSGRDGYQRLFKWDILESLMNEIPGMDNYPANIQDRSFGQTYLNPKTEKNLQAGYYHSWFRYKDADAMGQMVGHRGFADRQLFFAHNTRPEVSPKSMLMCEDGPCKTDTLRVSYAIPLEIVWLTPLNSWNPYNIQYKSKKAKDKVADSKRKGGFTKDTAFNGNDKSHYYRTPHKFFGGSEFEVDAADTTIPVAGVIGGDGKVYNVSASGIRILLPEIEGIEGNIRTRYPIFPVHEEGSTAYKDVQALQEIVMDLEHHMRMLRKQPNFGGVTYDEKFGKENPLSGPRLSPELLAQRTLYMTTATKTPPGPHTHSLLLNSVNYANLLKGWTVTQHTSLNNGHSHLLKFRLIKKTNEIVIWRCDDQPVCADGHDNILTLKNSE